jgi:tRNA modification GTPase
MHTIAAIVTPLSKAAVSIIRISGGDSFPIIKKLTGKSFADRIISLAWILDSQNKIDQALILPFRAPHSYTGEDVIEIQLHGGIWLTERVLELVLESGAQLAKAGEFTERAFINNKIDLSQAEAIMDLIEARTSGASANAIKLYEGYLGKEISNIRVELLDLLGELTAAIDFPDEVGDYEVNKFTEIIKKNILNIDEILISEHDGEILREGYKVAIIGSPNAGKSTLLNTLLRRERAIVTEIAGTTRDLIEESYSIKGLPIVLLDTAGLRTSNDKVEQIGISRTLEVIKEADLILYLEDLNDPYHPGYDLGNKELIKVGNKSDLINNDTNITNQFDIVISANTNTNIDKLKDLIFERISKSTKINDDIKINHRQADILRKSKGALEASLRATNESIDFWTIDLRQAIMYLGEITGETLSEELLDNIFSKFCIGK